jgi:trehalose/maltose hydrolase-like predicted phosphorylase
MTTRCAPAPATGLPRSGEWSTVGSVVQGHVDPEARAGAPWPPDSWHAFRLIGFVWEPAVVGTAPADVDRVRGAVVRLLGAGVSIVAVAGQADVPSGLVAPIPARDRSRLYLLVPAGVCRFDAALVPIWQWRPEAASPRAAIAAGMRWLLHEGPGAPPAVQASDVLLIGSAFGGGDGGPGRDADLLLPDTPARWVSVGPEPDGVPPPVVRLGGGPPTFHRLLAAQAALHPLDVPARPTEDPGWLLVEDDFSLVREHEIESLFAASNGYLGARASLAEGSPLSAPATFVAGVYASPETGQIPELAPTIDWTRLRATVDGQPFAFETATRFEERRVLDLRQAAVWRELRHVDAGGRETVVRGLRVASLADRQVLFQVVTMTPRNYGGRIVVDAVLSGACRVATPAGDEAILLEERPPGDRARLGIGVRSHLVAQDGAPLRRLVVAGAGDETVERWEIDAEVGLTYRLERVVAVHTSRDADDPVAAARAHVTRAAEDGAEAILARHAEAWRARWADADVLVEGDPAATRALRFAAYHLIGAANPEDDRVSIGARGLTGPGYKGHVFWDTDVFMLPFFVRTHAPTARALLMYRWHTLPGARAKAAAAGFAGALYAWESADDGTETTPPFALGPDGSVLRILSGEQEHHISADVALAAWRYWEATGDDGFLRDAGAEMLVETARFWASRGAFQEDGQYHIARVIGPDEYHESVDDNAFTNVMARWNLRRAADVVDLVAVRWPAHWRALVDRLAIRPGEAAEWRRIAGAMYTGFDPRTKLFEQFRGYFALDELDPKAHAAGATPLDVLLGRERVARSKVVKQADVVMLVALLWDEMPPDVRRANFRYYEPRTAHGSSLSPPVHALVAARLGDTALAARYFRQTWEIDLANNMGNAAAGVHLAALGGLWQAAILGFAGLETEGDVVRFRPHLPPGWRAMRFCVMHRGRRTAVRLGETGPTEATSEVA